MMLFPTATVLYGGGNLIFAAKEAVERRARKKGRAEERNRILDALKQKGVLSPEIAEVIAEQSEAQK